ncbi:hypothetical protein B0H13DRAFT_2301578 [Mycena leptocephala]|nr:hypothetical protein B0H13DRAFT_2301578 [Mycena leptocephala]
MEGILRRVSRCKYRSLIDGQDAYEQIRIVPEHVHRTAVSTPDGNMVSLVLQQGDCDATYQSLMNYLCMLSPSYQRHVPPSVHPQASQQSFNSSLRRSSSGSTVNITIVPPSRPPSVGQSHSAGPGFASSRSLSPNQTPVVPEEDEKDDDDDDDDEETDGSDAMPPGYVMGPLPAFARGVTYPAGFATTL